METEKNSKQLIKGAGVYGVGTFGTKILSFLIVPLYTYYIAASDMGIYDILISTINLLTPIITMQISDAAYRWIIRADIKNRDDYIRATIQVLLINCSVATLLILLVNRFHSIPYCAYFCAILLLSRVLQTMQKLLRGLKKQWLFAISGLIYTVVFLSLNVIQLCIWGMGVESLFQSAVAANIIALLVIILLEPKFRINVICRPDKWLIFEMYRYSVPLVPNYLNWWIINSSDRYIVLFALGSWANGILAIAHKFPSILQAVLNLFINSWQDISVADSEKDMGGYYSTVFRKYYLFALPSLFCLIPATKVVIILVMSRAYKSACDFVAFYYLGTVFQSFASFYGVGYLRSKQTGKAFRTSIYGAIINAVVNLCFVELIGLQAAAVSTFLGFLVMWLVRERQNKEELQIRINWFEFWALTLLAVWMSIASILMDMEFNIILTVTGFCIFVSLNYQNVLQLRKMLIGKINKK
ncbi:MAG: lipopolysaccharide biosynthesis protein [Lachnospiraceae bacterium]|nr:lipopolysaccharide biosynthesis protein [Lachnospiraceae bacterium]